jgi:hypothetical protein
MQKDSEEPTPVLPIRNTADAMLPALLPGVNRPRNMNKKRNTKYLVRFPRRETKSVLSLWMRHRTFVTLNFIPTAMHSVFFGS